MTTRRYGEARRQAIRAHLLWRRRLALSLRASELARERELRLRDVGDWVDQAEALTETRRLSALGEREYAEIREIDAALERLRRGDYGRCQRCGRWIRRRRLLVVPETSLCVACERSVERASGRDEHMQQLETEAG